MENEATTQQQGVIVWDSLHGLVCTCTRTENYTRLGAPRDPSYLQTVSIIGYTSERSMNGTFLKVGQWKHECSACGAVKWSDS